MPTLEELAHDIYKPPIDQLDEQGYFRNTSGITKTGIRGDPNAPRPQTIADMAQEIYGGDGLVYEQSVIQQDRSNRTADMPILMEDPVSTPMDALRAMGGAAGNIAGGVGHGLKAGVDSLGGGLARFGNAIPAYAVGMSSLAVPGPIGKSMHAWALKRLQKGEEVGRMGTEAAARELESAGGTGGISGEIGKRIAPVVSSAVGMAAGPAMAPALFAIDAGNAADIAAKDRGVTGAAANINTALQAGIAAITGQIFKGGFEGGLAGSLEKALASVARTSVDLTLTKMASDVSAKLSGVDPEKIDSLPKMAKWLGETAAHAAVDATLLHGAGGVVQGSRRIAEWAGKPGRTTAVLDAAGLPNDMDD